MKKNAFNKFMLLFIVAALCISLSAPANAKRKTRDLVFEDEETIEPEAETKAEEPKEKMVGVKATIELTRNGETTDVLPSHTFKSGDRVRLVYTTNVDAYVYWLMEGSSGDHRVLFPNQKVGMDNFVTKNTEYRIPTKGAFKFDENPGTEKLLLVMAPEPIPELDEAAKQSAIKGGTVQKMQEKQESKRKTRDLVFEEEEDDEAAVMTKKQKSMDINQPFVIDFVLIHD